MCRGIFTKLRPCHLSKPIAEPHNWNDGDVKIERSKIVSFTQGVYTCSNCLGASAAIIIPE